MNSTNKIAIPIASRANAGKLFAPVVAAAVYFSPFIVQVQAQTLKHVTVCASNRAYRLSEIPSKIVKNSLRVAAKRGRLTLPVSTASGPVRQGGCSRTERRSGTVKHIKLKNFDFFAINQILSNLIESLKNLGDLSSLSPSSEITDSQTSGSNSAPQISVSRNESDNNLMMSVFPPAPSDTHPASMPRTVRAFLQNSRFSELEERWTYDINKDLVVALSKSLNLYTIGGDEASLVSGFCYDCLAEGDHDLLQSTSGLSSLTAGISKTYSGEAYTSNVSIETGGIPVSFDSNGRVTIKINNRVADLSIADLHEPQYDYLSNGQRAQFFSIENGSGIQQYTWRYLTVSSTRRNLGVLITPLGGMSPAGNYEGVFIDFQANSLSSNTRSVNPAEYYFGSRPDSVLGVNRVDVTLVFPYGLRLRSTNRLGQMVRVQYSGLLSGLVTLPLVYGNPARIDNVIAQTYSSR